ITTQLIRTTSMDTSQRISATRVVYYLIVSSLIMALVIPFFAQIYLHKESDQPGRIAEVALNSLGIINLLLHIFLRSNAARAAIRPCKSMSSKKRPLRVFGPSDLEMTMHITSPVLMEEEAERLCENENQKLVGRPRGTSYLANNTDRLDKEAGPIRQHSHHSMSFDRSRRPPQDDNDHPQIIVQPSPFPHRKNSNYSIFPTFRSAMLRNSSSTTFSQGSEAQSLQPPKPVPAQPSNHKRDGSQQTSATVEIGFRLSAFSDERSPSNRSSSINSSLRRPLFGKTQSRGASPPISPLSARRPHVASMISTSGDSATLPRNMMSPRSLQNERLRRSILGYLSPGRRSQSSLRREQLRRLTMKALPPDPPMEVRLKPPGF
ncbi:MAG: hypothetical protein Q9202_007546, partial [Teloschistes flavicans]